MDASQTDYVSSLFGPRPTWQASLRSLCLLCASAGSGWQPCRLLRHHQCSSLCLHTFVGRRRGPSVLAPMPRLVGCPRQHWWRARWSFLRRVVVPRVLANAPRHSRIQERHYSCTEETLSMDKSWSWKKARNDQEAGVLARMTPRHLDELAKWQGLPSIHGNPC
jgi:hypothetical protein